jgi:hypothetical protein
MAQQLRTHDLQTNPDQLITLAAACLAAADTLGEHYRTGLRELALPADAFGNTRASAAPAGAAASVGAHAQQAVSAHVEVLEEDADALLQTAFAYLAADRQAARRRPL